MTIDLKQLEEAINKECPTIGTWHPSKTDIVLVCEAARAYLALSSRNDEPQQKAKSEGTERPTEQDGIDPRLIDYAEKLAKLRIAIIQSFNLPVKDGIPDDDVLCQALLQRPDTPQDLEDLKIEIDRELYKKWCDGGEKPNDTLAKCSTKIVNYIIDHLASKGIIFTMKNGGKDEG